MNAKEISPTMELVLHGVKFHGNLSHGKSSVPMENDMSMEILPARAFRSPGIFQKQSTTCEPFYIGGFKWQIWVKREKFDIGYPLVVDQTSEPVC